MLEMDKLAEKIRSDLRAMYIMLRFVVKVDENCVWVMDNPDGIQSLEPRKYQICSLDEWVALKARIEYEDRDFDRRWGELMEQVHEMFQRWVSEGLTLEQAHQYFWYGTGLSKKELAKWKERRSQATMV